MHRCTLSTFQIRALDAIDPPTQAKITAEVRQILATKYDAPLVEWKQRMTSLTTELAQTSVDSLPRVVRAKEALDGARQYVTEVRRHLATLRDDIRLGRASRRNPSLGVTRDEIDSASKQLRTRKARYDAIVMRARNDVAVARTEVRKQLRAAHRQVDEARRLRQAKLRKHDERHRRALSQKRESMVNDRRTAIHQAMDQVDRFAAAVVGTQQSFVRGSQLPFHQWMRGDPLLVAWSSDAKFFDAFEQIVHQVKQDV